MPHELRVALWILLALGGFVALGRHVIGHAERAFALPAWTRRAFLAWTTATVLCSFLARFAPDLLGASSPRLAQVAAVSVIGLMISSVLLWPLEAARAGRWLWRRVRRVGAGASARDPAEPAPSRRDFVRQVTVGGALSCGLGSVSYGTLVARHDYALETVPIALAKLPRALSGFTLVQLSDLHVGQFMDEAQRALGLRLAAQARPDAIVLTGDLIDHDLRYAERLFRFVRALGAQARYGVFAVPGNHDHYVGVHTIERGLREAGAEVLTNRHVMLGQGKQRLVLAGLDDVVGTRLSARGPNLERAFAGVPPDAPRVLLSHNPGYFPRSCTHADLTLSGHTHGGQISLLVNPAQLLSRHGFVRGLHNRDGSQLYVNRGFGTSGPPVRLGSAPEVTRLVLTA